MKRHTSQMQPVDLTQIMILTTNLTIFLNQENVKIGAIKELLSKFFSCDNAIKVML